MLSIGDILLRLGVAFLFGAVIGLERELDRQPAGLRTNIILVMGATLAMILSIDLAHRYPPVGGVADPNRLAAQVVSGVGFLGAGAILHAGVNIRGLTTAATIWTMAVVGLAVGAGYFIAAGAVTLMLFISLFLLEKFEHRFFKRMRMVPVTMWLEGHLPDLAELRHQFNPKEFALHSFSYEHDFQRGETVVNLEINYSKEENLVEIKQRLYEYPGLRRIQFGKTIFF